MLCLFVLLSVAGRTSALALDTQSSVGVKVAFADKKAKRRPRASGPSLTPANPSATPGQSITITSASPVTWSLSGVGALSNQTSNSVTYTAPASVVPAHQMLGCPVLPNDTVFNTPANNLPVDSNSAAMIAAQSAAPLGFETSWGISYADNSTPTRSFLSFYDSAIHPNFVFPVQGPNMRRESGDFVGTFSWGANRPDHHVMTVRRTDCTFWETYDDYTDGYLRTCNDGTTANCNVQSATTYGSTSYNFGSDWGTDAGGFPLAPLTLHVDEIKGGSIKHAVRFTEGLGGIKFGAFRWPATATAGGCSACPNAMPMGTRLRLKASYNISTYSTYAQTVLTALKTYGMILADTGSNNAVTVADDVWEDPAVGQALNEIRAGGIAISNFEVVDESSLQFGASSYAVCPMNQTCMGAENTYVQPASQAMITATPASGSATMLPVALQGIAIGLGTPSVMPVLAGSYSFQIPFWVNGSSNQTVNWTLVSGAGAVSSAGVYTPPATVSGSTPIATVLQGTSAADPNVSVFLYLNVLPPGTSPAGSIRIDSGASANTTDGNGNVWLADTGAEGILETFASDYPNWKTADPLRIVYQSEDIAYGNELRYNVVVPNGNYKVHLLFGALQVTCTPPCSTWPSGGLDTHSFNPQMLETQGVMQAHYFDWGLKAGYAYTQPQDIFLPAKVTNNVLEVAVYALAPDSGPVLAPAAGQKLNSLNGLEILPDASAPHWSIDTGTQTTIASGQTLRPFYVTDWYTGVNDPTWTIVSGPSGATLNGSTLSLAAGSYLNGQPIMVRASDGTYSATATIYTTGGTRAAFGLGATAAANHYSYKRAITINHSSVAADQTNFPVMVSMTDPTLENVGNGGHVQETHGYDIILTSDAAGINKLNWEVENYNPATGAWVGHVKIPTLSHTTDTVIYAFYGNPTITTDQSTPSSVWDANFKGVYHMSNLTATPIADSSSAGNNVLANVGVTQTLNGEIGSAALLAGGSSMQHLEIPSAVLNPSQGTISAWINSTLAAVSGQNWTTAGQSDSSNVFDFGYWTSYFNATIFGWENQGTDYRMQVPTSLMALPTNTWLYLAYSWNQSTNTQVAYLNGVAVKTVTTPFTPYTPASNMWIGSGSASGGYSFGGMLDEVRFSNVARGASWLATEFANQKSPATFFTVGSESGN